MRNVRAIGIAAMLALTAAAPATQPVFDQKLAAAHGTEALDLIRAQMALPERGLFAQDIHLGNRAYRPVAADCWSVGVMLTALTAGARLSPARYAADVRRFVDSLNSEYWSEYAGIGGYDDGPHPKAPDRYYDDNAWVALGAWSKRTRSPTSNETWTAPRPR